MQTVQSYCTPPQHYTSRARWYDLLDRTPCPFIQMFRHSFVIFCVFRTAFTVLVRSKNKPHTLSISIILSSSFQIISHCHIQTKYILDVQETSYHVRLEPTTLMYAKPLAAASFHCSFHCHTSLVLLAQMVLRNVPILCQAYNLKMFLITNKSNVKPMTSKDLYSMQYAYRKSQEYIFVCNSMYINMYINNIPVTFTWIPNLSHVINTPILGSISICRKNPARDERLSRPTLCELSAEFSTFSWTATLNTAWQVYLNPCMQKLPKKAQTCQNRRKVASVRLLWCWSSFVSEENTLPNAAHEHVKHCRHLGLVSHKAQHANLQYLLWSKGPLGQQ